VFSTRNFVPIVGQNDFNSVISFDARASSGIRGTPVVHTFGEGNISASFFSASENFTTIDISKISEKRKFQQLRGNCKPFFKNLKKNSENSKKKKPVQLPVILFTESGKIKISLGKP
jgi:hypothetical protein